MSRLTKIYTRQGDQGNTRLANGEKVAKNHPRIVAMGDIDMLNSQLGLLLAYLNERNTQADIATLIEQLTPCLHRLFDIGGELAMPEYQVITDEHVKYLEQLIDLWNDTLAPLSDFILPTGTIAASQAHICRAQARTAERCLQNLHHIEPVRKELLAYINRISDMFFVLARMINHYENIGETLWKKP